MIKIFNKIKFFHNFKIKLICEMISFTKVSKLT